MVMKLKKDQFSSITDMLFIVYDQITPHRTQLQPLAIKVISRFLQKLSSSIVNKIKISSMYQKENFNVYDETCLRPIECSKHMDHTIFVITQGYHYQWSNVKNLKGKKKLVRK